MINGDAFGTNMARVAAAVDYYAVLGISANASMDQIKQAYKRRAFELHPDKNQNNPDAQEQFALVGAAYGVLTDPERKKQYDYFRAMKFGRVTLSDSYQNGQGQQARASSVNNVWTDFFANAKAQRKWTEERRKHDEEQRKRAEEYVEAQRRWAEECVQERRKRDEEQRKRAEEYAEAQRRWAEEQLRCAEEYAEEQLKRAGLWDRYSVWRDCQERRR